MKNIDRTIILVLATLFLFAGIDKIFHYSGFVKALGNYVLVPQGTAAWIAGPLIGIEIVVGAALLIPSWRRPAALVAFGLLVGFTAALTVNYFFGGRGICGCWFTVTLAEGTSLHIVQNLVMAGLALIVGWESGSSGDEALPARILPRRG